MDNLAMNALSPTELKEIKKIISRLPNPGNHSIFISELVLHLCRLKRELACETQGVLSEKQESDLAILNKAKAVIFNYCAENTWPYFPGMASHEQLFHQRWNGANLQADVQDGWDNTSALQRLAFGAYWPIKQFIEHLTSMRSFGARGKKETDIKLDSFFAAVSLLFDRFIMRPTTTTNGPFYSLVSNLLKLLNFPHGNPRRRVEAAIKSLKSTVQP